jgi:uncharacterized protein with GYD domain
MPTYVLLMNWTDQGVRAAKDTVKRYEAAQPKLEQLGVTIRDIYWTVGPYDIVTIGEAADDETLSTALLTLAGDGNLRTTTLRGFSADEMRSVVEKMA